MSTGKSKSGCAFRQGGTPKDLNTVDTCKVLLVSSALPSNDYSKYWFSAIAQFRKAFELYYTVKYRKSKLFLTVILLLKNTIIRYTTKHPKGEDSLPFGVLRYYVFLLLFLAENAAFFVVIIVIRGCALTAEGSLELFEQILLILVQIFRDIHHNADELVASAPAVEYLDASAF